MRKLLPLLLTFICAFTTWALQTPAQVKYTITNLSSTQWNGTISSCESSADGLQDCDAKQQQNITVFPYSSTNNQFSIVRNTDFTVKDNLLIQLNRPCKYGCKTITWSNLTYISYPGLQFIESVNCIIPDSGDELICDFE